jgi:hypothetical protein
VRWACERAGVEVVDMKALGYVATGAVALFGLREASLAVTAILTMRIY